ncbi:MAG: carboxypeptidase regulatory-like domain-containing protein, partial [Clostridia bacterium]|nr:carboxypeptidase regulatory-like domain-containing protein [Clostridia bacterium]
MNRAAKRVISIILASAMQLSYLPAFSAAAYERPIINENGYSAESGSDIDIYTNIYGRVTDRGGAPVEGVSVLLWSIDENKALALCKTDSDGRWQSLDYDVVSG